MIFMKKEADEDQPVIPLKQFKKRVLQATGISNHLYKSAKKELSEIESGEKGSFSISKKPRLTRPVPKSTFTKGEKQAIRRIIHQYHVTEKGRPTLKEKLFWYATARSPHSMKYGMSFTEFPSSTSSTKAVSV
ncbi:hypothetical protein TcasGA2_TC001840 [Tribolium castaneum]|uniref:Uncharacterized protein n=1 Tax=Tribolium castaneum TaxID=7070 RepID=D7EJ73_TRICA|nr:hypothetical protein TcasGA2_TC001840 [Tribolium castaneum]